MEIKQLRANVGNYGPARNAQAIKYIVIHYTGNDGDTAMNNAKYYASTVVKSSARRTCASHGRSAAGSIPPARRRAAGRFTTSAGTQTASASSCATQSATGRMRPHRRLSRPLWR